MLTDTAGRTNRTTPSDGRPMLVSIVALEARDDSALLAVAASLARNVESPIAAAIVESAQERGIELRPVEHFHQSTAAGVVTSVGGQIVVLGNAALFRALRISVDNLGDWPERLTRRSERVLFVAIDGRTVGFLGVADGGL